MPFMIIFVSIFSMIKLSLAPSVCRGSTNLIRVPMHHTPSGNVTIEGGSVNIDAVQCIDCTIKVPKRGNHSYNTVG